MKEGKISIEAVDTEADFHIYRYDNPSRSDHLSKDNDIVMIGQDNSFQMNGVLAHEAKEVDIVKLAGLVARK